MASNLFNSFWIRAFLKNGLYPTLLRLFMYRAADIIDIVNLFDYEHKNSSNSSTA